jgi:hypothetical protein
MSIFDALSTLQTQSNHEETHAESSNELFISQIVEEVENSSQSSGWFQSGIQKGKDLTSQTWNSLPNLNVRNTADAAWKGARKIIKSPTSFVAGVAATAAVYQAGGLRYGTFNQLECVSPDTSFLNNELNNAYRIGNETENALNLHIDWLNQEGEAHFETLAELNAVQIQLNTTQVALKGLIDPTNSTALAEHELFTKTQLDEAVKNKAKQKDQEWTNKNLIDPKNKNDLKAQGLVDTKDQDSLKENKLYTEVQRNQDVIDAKDGLIDPESEDDLKNHDLVNFKDPEALKKKNLFTKEEHEKALKTKNQEWTNKGLINPHNETDLAAANLVKKANLKAVEKERDSRPDINLLRYAELLNKEKTLTNRPNVTLTEWENDWSKRPSQKLYDQEKTQHNRTKADLSNAQVKIKLAEEFGLTDWDNLKAQTGNETLTTLLARPTQKELENKTKELDRSDQQVGNLITQLNKLNSDLITLKESSQFEIVRLKTENENYKKQRDSRPDITFTDYQQLLNDKNNATLTIQGLEKNLNNTRVEFEKYQNATNQTIIEKDNKIKELQTDLTSWLDVFNNQTASQVKAGLDNKVKDYNTLDQAKLELEKKLSTKQTKIEWLNSIANSLEKKLGRTRSKRDTHKNDLTQTQKELTSANQKIRELEQEKTQILANVENFNQQLDDAQQELVRTQREKRKLAQKYQQEQDQHAKTQTQLKEQTSYLQSILGYLVKAGIATSSWKLGRDYGQGEMIIKHSEDTKKVQKIVQEGISALVKQKNQALQNQKKAEQERDQLQQQIENHHCSSTNSDQSLNKEQIKIIQSINQELNLGLDDPTLEQVIVEIKELIHKPPTSSFMTPPSNQAIKNQLHQAQQTITKLEKELREKETPFGEDLEVIKELELNSLEELFKQQIDAITIQQIQQATSYQQVVAARQAFLQKHLGQKENAIPAIVTKNELVQPANKERVVLISLLVGSLIMLGGLMIKLRGVKKESNN